MDPVLDNEDDFICDDSPKSLAKKEAKVYFYHGIHEYIDLSPVTRVVSAIAPARVAI